MDRYRGFDPFENDEQGQTPAYTVFEDSPQSVDSADFADMSVDFDAVPETDGVGIETPASIGHDERRMQVRAYNFWTAQLGVGNYPNIEELDPESVEDFRDNSVLLDFTSGVENPSIQYLGEALRRECRVDADISYLDQVPPRSLLSRITDHYMQIIANRAPIGFEAEFVNDADVNIMYRGILLPYSSDDDTIDFIYGVINWKEAAGAELAASLNAEVNEALAAVAPHRDHVPVWADGPANHTADIAPVVIDETEPFELAGFAEVETEPSEDAALDSWLSFARDCADLAAAADVRSRDALYNAIGRAYDFSLIAESQAEDYSQLLAQNGLVVQDRAPMTPVVKLIFGANYDKTRLTEFAAALDYAHRNMVPRGHLADVIGRQEGGLKGIVQAERRARKVEKGGHITAAPADPRLRLRSARARNLSEFATGDSEFVVLVARREDDGTLVLVGSVDDLGLTDKALAKAIV
jgi:hypothetical protein